jgi:hypothetical protein
MRTGQEKALTTDGTTYFGYATDNAGWSSSDRADPSLVARFEEDRHSATGRAQRRRDVSRQHDRRPPDASRVEVSAARRSGDGDVHRVVIDVDSGRITRLQMPPDFHRATLGDDISMNDYIWSPDGSRLALASVSRDHKRVVLRVADTATGAVRDVFEETVATQFESRSGWRVAVANQRGGVALGARQLGPALSLRFANRQAETRRSRPATARSCRSRASTRRREPSGSARTAASLVRIRTSFTTTAPVSTRGPVVSLTPDDGTHAVQLSPSGRHLIDTYSKPDVPPVVVLRDAESGAVELSLEKADISQLLATGWKPPTPIKMTAHDGKTDIYGLLFRPTNFDPSRKYPIVNNVYPGPQTGSTGSRAFTPARGDRQALAELGFIVVTIDGMGTPGRSKSFQDAYYGAMGRDNTIPDQIAGMQELARRYPWIDIERAGIWGHSGGGFATTTAMFRFSRFLQGGHRGVGQPRPAGERGRLGRTLSGSPSSRTPTVPTATMPKPTRPSRRTSRAPAARPRHDGHERPAVSDDAGRRRADQGQQGLRSPHDSERESWLRRGVELHDAAPLGLFREVADRRRPAEGVPHDRRCGSNAGRVTWQPQTSGVTGRLRGVSAVSPTVAWASGAAGTVLRTTDGGDHWQLRAVAGAETLDFRDVDAMSDQVAYALSIGAGASSRIYKTIDGGAHWDLQFANTDPKVFLDAMAFWDAERGIAFSDSVDGRFVILTTGNGGRSWERVPADRCRRLFPARERSRRAARTSP